MAREDENEESKKQRHEGKIDPATRTDERQDRHNQRDAQAVLSLEDVGWVPEPHASLDVGQFPLWQKALAVAERSDVPSWFIQEACIDQQELWCCSAACIVVTSAGRIVAQQRQEGLQHFGGGKRGQSIVNQVHLARRELFWESNLDLNNGAVSFVSEPFFVTSGSQGHWAWWGTCLINIVVCDDEQVSVDVNGAVKIGGSQLWSRELVRGDECYKASPAAAAIEAGAFFRGQPIFRVIELDFSRMELWRAIDSASLGLLRQEIVAAIELKWRPPRAYFRWEDAGVPVAEQRDYEQLVQEFIRLWRQYFGDIGAQRWPLLATPLLYKTLISRDWRCREVTGHLGIAPTSKEDFLMCLVRHREEHPAGGRGAACAAPAVNARSAL